MYLRFPATVGVETSVYGVFFADYRLAVLPSWVGTLDAEDVACDDADAAEGGQGGAGWSVDERCSNGVRDR